MAANALMTQQNISNQPGAGQTQDLGTLPGDSGDSGDGSDGSGGVASDDQLATGNGRNPAEFFKSASSGGLRTAANFQLR